MSSLAINPYYAARIKRFAPSRQESPAQAVYAKLPRAPINASPVPGLTSLYHNSEAGNYGNRGIPRQLRRQPHQRPAALFPRAFVLRSDDRQWHLPRRVQRDWVSTAGPATCTRVRTLATARNSPASASSLPGFIRPIGGKNYTRMTRDACRGRRPWRRSLNAIGC